MMFLALYAAAAYSPADGADAAGLLALALTAAVVYPVIAFGAIFVLIAVYTLANTLTVEVDTAAIRCVRRVLGFKFSQREMPAAAISAIEQEATPSPRVLGGAPRYRLVATSAQGPKLVVAEALRDEATCRSLQSLIEKRVQTGLTNR